MSRDLVLGLILGAVGVLTLQLAGAFNAPSAIGSEAREAELDRAFGAGRTEAMLIQCQADLKVARGER